MVQGGQYGEDRILESFFEGKDEGFVVEIGAADGEDNSNSWHLLKRPGWQGLLVEPEPSQYATLKARYQDRDGVDTVNCACGPETGMGTFYIGGEGHKQGSTMSLEWKQRLEKDYGATYPGTAKVDVVTLADLFMVNGVPSVLDFLSIDCEGLDYPVLQSINWKTWKPKLICMEGGGFALPENYKEYCLTRGNTFYVRVD